MAMKINNMPPSNKYERVLVAAREARRLNEWDSQLIERPYRRLCEEAVTRVEKGAVRYTYDPPAPPAPSSVPNPLLPSPPAAGNGDTEEE
jgi:DNA-directed RNA polymerase subunit K/omega